MAFLVVDLLDGGVNNEGAIKDGSESFDGLVFFFFFVFFFLVGVAFYTSTIFRLGDLFF